MNPAKRLRKYAFLLGIVLAAVTGCSSYKEQIAAYRMAYSAGDMTSAGEKIAELVEDNAGEDHGRDTLPVLLEAGTLFRTAGQFRMSQQMFARAEKTYDYWQNMARFSLSREGISLLTNPATLPYRGSGADILMLNTYQALNALTLGDIQGARQPLMRLYTHQQEVVADNAERIAKTREATEKSKDSAAIDQTAKSNQAAEVTEKMMARLPDTRGYELYVNPFATYLRAFYHGYAGVDDADRETARFEMARVAAMAPENRAVRHDLERLQAGNRLPPSVYLFHENGMSPWRKEQEFYLPIYAGGTLSMVAMALPTLETDADCGAFAEIRSGGTRATAELLCDMEAVIAQEYKNDFPGLLTRAIASATAKAVAAYAANYAAQQSGDVFIQLGTFIATAAYQVATNVADTRSWVSLPKHIGVTRLDLPADRRVALYLNGQRLETVSLPSQGDVYVIYLRTMHRGSKPSVQLFRMR